MIRSERHGQETRLDIKQAWYPQAESSKLEIHYPAANEVEVSLPVKGVVETPDRIRAGQSTH